MQWIVSIVFVLGAVAGMSAACAHPGLETKEAKIGASYKAVIKIPHGCQTSATTKVRVQIPEGVIAVKPMPKPGWTIAMVRGPYAQSYPYYHGAVLTEGVREIVWSGSLPDDHFDEFVFSGFPGGQLAGRHDAVFPDLPGLREGLACVDRGAGGRPERAAACLAGRRCEAARVGQEGDDL